MRYEIAKQDFRRQMWGHGFQVGVDRWLLGGLVHDMI
jgi:hypothetical protein